MFSKIALAGVNKNLDPEKPAFRSSKLVSWSWPSKATLFLALPLVHLLVLSVCAATLQLPQDVSIIRGAINAATNGDTVQAAPYFPIVSGDSWTYQDNGASFTRMVLPGVVTINGLATKALKDSPPEKKFRRA